MKSIASYTRREYEKDVFIHEHRALRFFTLLFGIAGIVTTFIFVFTLKYFLLPFPIIWVILEAFYYSTLNSGYNAYIQMATSKPTIKQNASQVPNHSSTQTYSPSSSQTKSDADEIREFKQLLDDGIITQEEFEIKKRSIICKENEHIQDNTFIRKNHSTFSDKLFEMLDKCKTAKQIQDYLTKLQWDKFEKFIDPNVISLLDPVVNEETPSTNKKNEALTIVDSCIK